MMGPEVLRELSPDELRQLPMLPRSLMRGAGICPSHAARRSMPIRPTRAGHDGEFFVEDSGLSWTHIHVLEAIVGSAFAGADLRSGELSLRFQPGDALRAMGLSNGNRPWLRARLKELGSPFGVLPRELDGGDFSILRTIATDTPSAKVFANVITGFDDDGNHVRTTMHATIWTVRLSMGYRAWMDSQASLRHPHLANLRALKCAAAESVARYALTGGCNVELPTLLARLGIIAADYSTDSKSARYQAARHAISKVLSLSPALAAMGVNVVSQAGLVRVASKDRPDGLRFFPPRHRARQSARAFAQPTPHISTCDEQPSRMVALSARLAGNR